MNQACFVYHVDAARLFHCQSAPQALALAAAASDTEWLFFAADGSPLRRSFWADGQAYLRPWAACGSCHLAQIESLVQARIDLRHTEALP